MQVVRGAWLTAALSCVAGACGGPPTAVDVDVSAPGLSVSALVFDVAVNALPVKHVPIGPPGQAPHLPGTVELVLPNIAADVTVTAVATLAGGGTLVGSGHASVLPHGRALIPIALGAGEYTWKRSLTVANPGTTGVPAGYSVRAPLDLVVGHARADFSDVAIFTDTGTEIDRIIDVAPPGQTPAAWFALTAPLAAGTTATYWLDYSAPASVTPLHNDGAVFAFSDNFSGPLSSRWTTRGAPTLAGGFLTLHASGMDALRTDAATDNVPLYSVFEARAQATNPGSAGVPGGGTTFWYWLGYQRQSDFLATPPWVLMIARGVSTVRGEVSSGTAACSPCVGADGLQTNGFRWYRIERDTAQTRFFVDGQSIFTAPEGAQADYALTLQNYATTSDLVVDWVRARALITPEPTVTVGPELPAP